MNKLIIVLVVFILTGCSSSATPNYINGNYYMSGDDNCKYGDVNNKNYLVCYNSNREFTEYRLPISKKQAQQWYESKKQ